MDTLKNVVQASPGGVRHTTYTHNSIVGRYRVNEYTEALKSAKLFENGIRFADRSRSLPVARSGKTQKRRTNR